MTASDRLLKDLVRLLVLAYYRRVEAKGLDRLPASGPVLLTPNHPNSLFDSLALGSVTPRRIRFVAKHTLFSGPLLPLLKWAGILPIHRQQDAGEGGGSMRDNLQAFEACFRVLEEGGAVGIFPEGITHDQPRLAQVKTGPARIALGAEARHGFALGLAVVPVGLHFPRKAAWRSDAVIAFGEPVRVADWKDRHAADARGAVRALTAEIEARIKGLLPQVDAGDEPVVAAVAAAYEDAPASAEEDRLRRQEVADAVRHFRAADPALVKRLGGEALRFQRLLDRIGISHRTLARSLSLEALREEGLPRAAALVLGFPLMLYGLLNNLLTSRLAALSVRLFARKEDQTMIALQRVLGGVVGIPITYAAQGLAVWRIWGLHAALGYVATCPVSGLFAWWWLRKLASAAVTLEEGALLLTHRWLLWRLRRRRIRLRNDLDLARKRFRADIAQDAAP